MANVYQPSRGGEFRHDLFECFDDITDCLLACCCPPCYAYMAAQAAGDDMLSSVLNCLFYPLCLCCLRSRVREDRGIEGGFCMDVLVTQCCPCCASIQIKREFSN